MTDIPLQNFDPKNFLKNYWQKQPCIIKQALPGFIDPVDEHDLAGLATEEDIDARIISQHNQQWQVSHGPIDDFSQACVGDWTLLVQGVDQHIPDSLPLVSLFNFLPYWRIDDLMVSYSVANAGVGAHIDQYDVFIVQGKGKRRWQVGEKGHYAEFCPHPDIRQIESFNPIIDQVLEPGDIIYIPPGFPHHGVALEECINYSIGFRAPNQTELFSDLIDYIQESALFSKRYSDENIPLRAHPSMVLRNEIKSLKQLMHDAIDTPAFDQLLLKSLSQTHTNEQLDVDECFTELEVAQQLQQGQVFCRSSDAKAVYAENLASDNFIFFIQGQPFCATIEIKHLLLELFAQDRFDAKNTIKSAVWLEFVKIFTILINAGYWYPAE